MVLKHCVLGCLAVVATWGLPTARTHGQNLDILSGQRLDPSRITGAVDDPRSIVSVKAEVLAAPGRAPMLAITATIAPPWYTYSTTQKPIQATPTKITVDPSPAYQIGGEFRANLPPAIHREDGVDFETYGPEVTWQALLEVAPTTDLKQLKVTGRARIQVCQTGKCLPPSDFPFEATLAASSGAADAGHERTGQYANPNVHVMLRGHLEPKSVAPGSTTNLVITAEPAPGWHIYEMAARDTGSIGYKPTLIALTNTSGFVARATQPSEPPVTIKPAVPNDPVQRYYERTITWTTPIQIPPGTKPGEYPIEGLIGYQTCTSTGCDQPRGVRFDGVLTVGQPGGKSAAPLGFREALYGEAAKAAELYHRTGDDGALAIASTGVSTLPMIILLSLVGGFILNFMPCVLPVIGLKILSFAEQAGKSRAQILALNIWYSLGSLSVFFVLATLATAVNLGLAEQNFGWGQQFQYTSFNVAMVGIVFVMALSFLGVWEIPIPGFVGSGQASEMAAREGAAGAFVKGVVTTVLATPCSGPALGSVFGFTLTQPPLITYLIFGCIGLGMSAPYLLIGAFPHLIRFLPKPGAWMDTFKQMMGFVMLGTIVFFFSFMKHEYIVPTFAMMIGLWAACWWIGRTPLYEAYPRLIKAWGQGAIFAILIGWLSFTWLVPSKSIIPWKGFSQTELAKLNGEGNTVLVDFTADWCFTCKFNLRVAIETKEVRAALDKNNVVPLLADFTDESPDIKSMLARLQSNSIPVLAIFPADKSKETIILRDVISQKDVLSALEKAGPSKVKTKALTASMR